MQTLKDGARGTVSSMRRYLCFVVGYNWVVTITLLPFAILTVWPITHLMESPSTKAPVCVPICIAYVFFEVTAFWLERNWSRISIWRFWRVAAPFVAIHVACCYFFAYRDPLGCIIFSAVCLCLREAIFELVEAGSEVIGYGLKDRVTSALLGGAAYGAFAGLLTSGAYLAVRATRLRVAGLHSPTFEILFVLVLPAFRFLLRVALAQSVAGAVCGHWQPSVAVPEPREPRLDALLVYGDFLFTLTMFLEIPFAFILLYVPHIVTFWLAVTANAVLDVLFVYVLDALQQRRLRQMLLAPPPSAGRPESGLAAAHWAPKYSLERPTSVVAVAMNCIVECTGPTEATKLRAASGPAPATAAATGEAQAPVPPEEPVGDSRRSYCPRLRCLEGSSSPPNSAQAPISPRVSVLLDEYDQMYLRSQEGKKAAGGAIGAGGESAITIYLYQERKIPFLTHLLGNTVAAAFACLSIAVVGLHRFSGGELALRICVLLIFRVKADLASCGVLEWLCTAIPRDRLTTLWEKRQELSTLHGWFFRLLASLCPLFAVVVAATTLRVPPVLR